MKLFLGFLSIASMALAAGQVDACQTLERHGKRNEAKSCYQKLVGSSNPAVRAEGFWALHSYDQANEQFKLAIAQQPKNPDIRVRWGRLFLERFNKADAQQLFKEAMELDPKHAGASLGMALLASDGYEQQAVEFAQKALELDPK